MTSQELEASREQRRRQRRTIEIGILVGLALGAILLASLACQALTGLPLTADPTPTVQLIFPTSQTQPAVNLTERALTPPTREPGAPLITPTPNNPAALPTLRNEPQTHIVQFGETLGIIANAYGVSVQQIIAANTIPNPDIIEVGLTLTIPAPEPQAGDYSFKVIPDSELVYGPYSALFDTAGFIQSQGGYLSNYSEVVDYSTRSGAQIVQQVATEFSVNPRLLLAVLEAQSGWVTNPEPATETLVYPIGLIDTRRQGLYRQLAFAANELNRGFYIWQAGGSAAWILADGSLQSVSPVINAGTAGVQSFYAQLYGQTAWANAVGANGLFSVYFRLFGYPFDYAYEPLLPASLTQPPLQLPFEPGATWAFTGGPHGGWADGSGWAALDFAPPGEPMGCTISDAWVTAIADGLIVRSDDGAIVLDLDGDGYEQTGWTIFYLHMDAYQRISAGRQVRSGDLLGHPSCEGGVSYATHVHIARRYNGVWISADGPQPFVMEGWVSAGAGREYDGTLTRDGVVIEAYDGVSPENEIRR